MESTLKDLYINFLTEPQNIYLGKKSFDDFIDHFIGFIRDVDGIFSHFSEDELVLYIFCDTTDDLLLSVKIDEDYNKFNIYSSSDSEFILLNAKKVGSAALYLLQAYTEWNVNLEKEKRLIKSPENIEEDRVKYSCMIDSSKIEASLKSKLDSLIMKENKMSKHKLSKIKDKKYKITIIGIEQDEDSIDDDDLEWL